MDLYHILTLLFYIAVLVLLWAELTDLLRTSHLARNPRILLESKEKTVPRSVYLCILWMCLYLSATALRLFLFPGRFELIDHIGYFFCAFLGYGILFGVRAAITFQSLYECGLIRQLKAGWIVLKLSLFPFVLLNAWLYRQTMESVAPMAPVEPIEYLGRLLVFLALPVPILIPYVLPLMLHCIYGQVGVNYIRCLKKLLPDNRQPSRLHYVLQMLPVLDIISMVFILVNYRNVNPDAQSSAPDEGTKKLPADSAFSTAPSQTLYDTFCKHRKLFLLLYVLCAVLLYFHGAVANAVEETYAAATATYCELTAEEISLMQKLYSNGRHPERIAAGQLTDEQFFTLNYVRVGCRHIENKYPIRQFHVTDISTYDPGDTVSRTTPADRFTFDVAPASSDAETYRLVLSRKPGFLPDYVIEDNLYAFYLEESYFGYMEKQIAGDIPGFAGFGTDNQDGWYLTSYDTPAKLTVESVLNGTSLAGPRFADVYIAAGGRTEEECKAQREALTAVLHRIELPVERYDVYYFDCSQEELMSGDIGMEAAFTSFRVAGKPAPNAN